MMKINFKKISILLLTFSIIGLISLGAVSAQNILTDNVTNIDPMSTGGHPYYVHHNTDGIYKGNSKAIIGNPYKYVNNTKTVNNKAPYNIDPMSTGGNPYKYGNKLNSNTTGNEILENNISEVPVKNNTHKHHKHHKTYCIVYIYPNIDYYEYLQYHFPYRELMLGIISLGATSAQEIPTDNTITDSINSVGNNLQIRSLKTMMVPTKPMGPIINT